jgi:hypothetical protein
VNNEWKELREFTDRGFGKELRSMRITQKSNILQMKIKSKSRL